MAFIDDYIAWVTGPSVRLNRSEIQNIINSALE